MELTLVNLEKIPRVNFGIGNLYEKICKFVLICLEFSGTPLFFIRISKNSDDDFQAIFSYFIDEIAERFSLQKKDAEKFIGEKSGGYLWVTKKDKKMEICVSYNYGINYDQGFTIDLLNKELKLEV